jgi:serine/threonine protein kinase
VFNQIVQNNVLVEGNGNILLCDFGLSKIRRDDSYVQRHTSSTVKFNAPWAAPELIFSYRNLGRDPGPEKSSDIYSLGSVMLQVNLIITALDL